jgi:hypothetical protein
MIYPCSFVFRRRADPPHPNRLKFRGSKPQGPFEIGRVGQVANSNLGNGNLRPETFGETRQELPMRITEPPAETGPWEATYGNVVLSCRVGNHVGLRGLPGGAEGIRTDGHRGCGEISSWLAACGIRSPAQGRLGGVFAFRLAASRYPGKRKDLRCHISLRSRRRKETKVSTENTSTHPSQNRVGHLG